MNSSRTVRLFLVCLLAAALAVPSWGASPGGRPTRSADPMARLWSALTAVWAEAGCWLDPHGGCTAGSPEAAGKDEGCWLDPNGGHCAAGQSAAPAPLPRTDEGCWIDPHGGCAAGS
jgi:hypothetical protein